MAQPSSSRSLDTAYNISALKRPASARVRPLEENGALLEKLYRTDIEADFLVKGVRARRENNPFIRHYQGCFEVLENVIDFDQVALGTRVSKIFRCRNMSSVVERVRLQGGKDGRLAYRMLSTTAVAPGMSAAIQLTVSGDALGELREVLVLQAGKEKYEITVLANVRIAEKVQKSNTQIYSRFDADLLDIVPRLPGTFFNLKTGRLCFERPFHYEIDPELSLEDLKERDMELEKGFLNAPILPHCIRIYNQIRPTDERLEG